MNPQTSTAVGASPSTSIVLSLAVSMMLLLSSCGRDPAPVQPSLTPEMSYAAVARGRIDVEGGMLMLGMPIEGTLSEVKVHENDQVAGGQILATLDSSDAHTALELAQAKFEKSQIQPRLLAEHLNASRQHSRRLAAAALNGAGDGQSADDAAQAVRQLEADLQDAKATSRIAAAELEQARHMLDKHTLRSPFAAEVIHVAAQPGATVSPQLSALVTLLPSKPRIVRSELNESFVGTVKIGMRAQIVSDDDAQTPISNAQVLRIGSIYGPSTIDDAADAHIGERSVECVLALNNKGLLRVGQRVLVRFLHDRPVKG